MKTRGYDTIWLKKGRFFKTKDYFDMKLLGSGYPQISFFIPSIIYEKSITKIHIRDLKQIYLFSTIFKQCID